MSKKSASHRHRNGGDGEPGGGPIIIYGVFAAILLIVISFALAITGFSNLLRTQLVSFAPFFKLHGTVEADFTAITATAGTAPLKVQFTNLSQGSISECLWDFGNGGQIYEGCTAEKGIVHEYIQPGLYSVTLRVVSTDGKSDDEIRENYILVR